MSRRPPVVTEKQIREGMATLARIMQEHPNGEKFWPLFERLERELALCQSKKSRLAAALAFTQESTDRSEARF
ncbi:hypothetical protein SAMN05892877_11022 [Rhizobium subbaraonis]|uniref:Uncharacterized protein n=1 Tax=Rhizobium subbaraonis TaxID=908946 RepID=A0A285UKS0_9HYPH|nr:hypothetical protein [Rhizobium subbaraonis]SOC42480.1 hypothetical protein SAMN05892877_11022 [Rhizobium subbaraonis]